MDPFYSFLIGYLAGFFTVLWIASTGGKSVPGLNETDFDPQIDQCPITPMDESTRIILADLIKNGFATSSGTIIREHGTAKGYCKGSSNDNSIQLIAELTGGRVVDSESHH